MRSSAERSRPNLKRAAKEGQDDQARKTYGISSVPVNDEDSKAKGKSMSPTRRNKRARKFVVQPQVSASIVHNDARDADFSMSLENGTQTTLESSPNSLSTLSESLHEFGSASSPTIISPRQFPVLPPSPVASCDDVSLRPFGQPEIWAEQRQNLCEALPYYRAFQSGSYTSEGLAYGFLLDRDCGERSYMDEEIMITRAGGGCSPDENGKMHQSDDQSRSAPHIAAFFRNKEYRLPIGMIVGSSNASCPTKVPHRYCVMGWFQVTHIWAEKSNGKTCFKFRLEKIDLKSKSWWAPSNTPMPPTDRDFVTKTECCTCVKCTVESIQVFQQTWMCLNEACPLFWTVNGGKPPAGLTYNPTFLSERSEWPKRIKPPFPLRPAVFTVDPGHPELAYSLASWKGMVCPNCGRCNSRILWRKWRCATQGCGFWHDIQLTPVSPLSVLPNHGAEYVGMAAPQDTWDTKIVQMCRLDFFNRWRIHTYEILPGNIITHFHSNGPLNNVAGGAHDMFRALQDADMGLQRFPLTSSPIQGEMLTKHFATNYGMPYKYIVAVDSKSFSEAPQVIMDGLANLTWAGRKAVTDGAPGAMYQDCNELLALGYFEKQSMSYHDDGEKGLGPTIATMSLGGDAVMTIRMKAKFYFAKKRKSTDPLLPGCLQDEEPVQLDTDEVNMSTADCIESNDKDEILKPTTKEKPKKVREILKMKLKHGDIVVMHGHDIQRYYEHQVVPQGKLRFALTTRYIDPSNIPEAERWKGDFNPLDLRTRLDDLDGMDDADSATASDEFSQSPVENGTATATDDFSQSPVKNGTATATDEFSQSPVKNGTATATDEFSQSPVGNGTATANDEFLQSSVGSGTATANDEFLQSPAGNGTATANDEFSQRPVGNGTATVTDKFSQRPVGNGTATANDEFLQSSVGSGTATANDEFLQSPAGNGTATANDEFSQRPVENGIADALIVDAPQPLSFEAPMQSSSAPEQMIIDTHAEDDAMSLTGHDLPPDTIESTSDNYPCVHANPVENADQDSFGLGYDSGPV